jgi:hypothetical protein
VRPLGGTASSSQMNTRPARSGGAGLTSPASAFRRSPSRVDRRGTRANRAPTSDQLCRTVPHRPEPSAPIDQQAVAVDAQQTALDVLGAADRRAVATERRFTISNPSQPTSVVRCRHEAAHHRMTLPARVLRR